MVVVKAIINAIGKNKPKKFPLGTQKFNKDQAQSLLDKAQIKIQEYQKTPDKLPKNKIYDVEIPETSISNQNVIKDTTLQIKPSKKTTVDNFLSEEEKLLKNTQLDGNESEFLNFNKINASKDILTSIEAMAKTNTKAIKKQTRKTRSWKDTNDAADLALLTGQDANKLAANLLKVRPGKAFNAEEIRAAKKLLISQHKKLTELSAKLKTEAGDNSKTALEYAQQHALTAELTKVFIGVRSEAGRALNILKEPVQEGNIINLELGALNRKNILMNLGGADQIKRIAALYDETPGLIGKNNFIEKAYGAKTADALVEVFLNNILSGTLTHIKNVGGNFVFKSIERTERKIAARMYGGKTIDSVAEYEDVALAFGEHMAVSNMIRAFSQKWQTKKVLKNIFRNTPGVNSSIAGTKFESPVNAFSAEAFGMKDGVFAKFVDVTGKIFTLDRIPYRFLQNADNYFKNQAYSGEIYAQAYRDTLKQIKQGTLTLQDAPDYLAQLVVNPDKTLTTAAYDKALERTFQTPLNNRKDFIGDAAELLQQLKTKDSFKPFGLFSSQYFTFLRTPTNITGSAWERMPVANLILKNYRKALSTPGAASELASAKAALGWGFLSVFGTLGYFGVFSGSDVDIKGSLRDKYQLKKAGVRQPKSFRFENFLSGEIQELTGLTGSKLQLSLNGFEPAIFMASMAADVGAIISNIQEDWDGWKNVSDDFQYFLSAYALAFGENVLNSTFMNGSARLMDFIQNMRMSDDKVDPALREGKKILSGLVPFAMFLNQFEDLGSKEIASEKYGVVNADDFQKLNLEFKSMVQKMVPGFENDLYFNYDWLGDEAPKFSVLSSIEEDPINKEAIAIGYVPRPVRKKIQHKVFEIQDQDLDYGIDVNVRLNEKEYATLAKHTGKTIKKYLRELLNSAQYQNEPNKPFKKAMFEAEVEAAKADAKADFKDVNINPLWSDIENRAEDLAVEKWKKMEK